MSEPDPGDPSENPFQRVTNHWEAVIEDMHATAETYRDDGWTVVAVHPGDVTVVTDEPRTAAEQDGDVDSESRRLGFDIVVPGDEFERFRGALADRTVAECRVYGASGSGVVYRVVAVETTDGEVAALVPLYYERSDEQALRRVAEADGLSTHVRPLRADEVLTVEHENPEPFFPDADGGK